LSETCGDNGGVTNKGKPCKRKAGAGTNHEGEGRCFDHEINMLEKYGIEIDKVESLAAAGLPISSETAPDIKGYFSVGETTWHKMQNKHPELREAYKRGRSNASADVGKSLFQKAKNGDIIAQKFYLKCQSGWKPTEKREVSGPDGGPVEQQIEVAPTEELSAEEWEAKYGGSGES